MVRHLRRIKPGKCAILDPALDPALDPERGEGRPSTNSYGTRLYSGFSVF